MPAVFFVLRISGFFRHLEFVIRHSFLNASIGSTFNRREGPENKTGMPRIVPQ